jgi:hypothetical protein
VAIGARQRGTRTVGRTLALDVFETLHASHAGRRTDGCTPRAVIEDRGTSVGRGLAHLPIGGLLDGVTIGELDQRPVVGNAHIGRPCIGRPCIERPCIEIGHAHIGRHCIE